MFSSDHNIEAISRLLTNAKKYGELRLNSFEHTTVEKLTTLFTALIMGAVILLVSLIVVIFLGAAAVVGLAPHVGGYFVALLIVGAFFLCILGVVYLRRHSIIAAPIKAALAQIFFAEHAADPAPTSAEMDEAKQTLVDDYEALTSPKKPANNNFDRAIQTASKAWSIADGAIMGYKLYKRFSPFFRRKKRK